MHSQKPFVKRYVATLKEGANGYAKLLAARLALVYPATDFIGLGLGSSFTDYPAMRANGAIRPAEVFQIFAGLGFIGKDGVLESGFHGYVLSTGANYGMGRGLSST